MDPKDRNEEIQYLNKVLEEIRSQLTAAEGNHQKYQVDLDEALSDYWENIYTDFWDEAQFIETVARERNIMTASYQRQRQLRKLLESPYFGRIDFAEEGPAGLGLPEPVYIGVATLSDGATKALLIYDWRSPIASLFYDHERGPAAYQCPAGYISGVITLKRQYKIVHGHIEYLFDSDLKIDDEILQEILGKNADSKMHAIITSIQREQNRVIRDDIHPVLFVQGPAGSGKTSIALHRVAYLLYRDRNAITSKNILIFSPNRIFGDYISNVLPELGEENVQQTTFNDYLLHALTDLPVEIEERDAQLEYLYAKTADPNYATRAASIRYKSSPQFLTVIQNYLSEIQSRIQNYSAIEFQGETIIPREEWDSLFTKDLSFLPIAKRLAQLRQLIQKRIRPIIHRLRREEENKIAATGEEVNERTIKTLARLAVKRQTEDFIAGIAERTRVNPLVLYRRLHEDDTLFHRLSRGTRIPSEWPAIRGMTLAMLDHGQLPYEDSIALLFLKGSLEGFPAKNNIRQLVIDEAQDYTLLQYEILKQLFPKSSWTILGDPAQSIHPYLQTADFQTAAHLLESVSPDRQPPIIRLTKSYRSTREIQAFAGEMLGETLPVEPIQRPGPLPQVIRMVHPETCTGAIRQIIEGFLQEGWKSIAVICKTLNEANHAFEGLKNLLPLKLVTPEMSGFQQGTLVIPAYLAKGLEFDAVLVHNADSTTYSDEAERNILYTICTRALHRLVLFIQGEPSPFIEAIDSKLYQKLNL